MKIQHVSGGGCRIGATRYVTSALGAATYFRAFPRPSPGAPRHHVGAQRRCVDCVGSAVSGGGAAGAGLGRVRQAPREARIAPDHLLSPLPKLRAVPPQKLEVRAGAVHQDLRRLAGEPAAELQALDLLQARRLEQLAQPGGGDLGDHQRERAPALAALGEGLGGAIPDARGV